MNELQSMLNRWIYSKEPGTDVCYGEEIVYRKAREFLGDTCEDWGCGTGWGRLYFTNYKGIDGSLSAFVTNRAELVDLVSYTSTADNILLRQVIEHNYQWRKILQNVKQSFQKKLCITVHTPLAEQTTILTVDPTNDVPDVSFKLSDILDYFSDCKVTTETIETKFEYGVETIIYIEK